ncbi:hypothetical protein LTR60_007330, partial [Cryomyces antarcticus]
DEVQPHRLRRPGWIGWSCRSNLLAHREQHQWTSSQRHWTSCFRYRSGYGGKQQGSFSDKQQGGLSDKQQAGCLHGRCIQHLSGQSRADCFDCRCRLCSGTM